MICCRSRRYKKRNGRALAMLHQLLSQCWQRVLSNYSTAKAAFAILGMAAAIFLIAGAPAQAQALDGLAIKELALRGTWNAQSSGWGFWSWDEDGSVCLRLNEPTGECSDTGTWAIDGDSICYEFEWVWESEGQRALCLHINDLGGHYEAQHKGLVATSLFKFEVIDSDT
jgi:hypothetical protein